jgi:hypothetical protein
MSYSQSIFRSSLLYRPAQTARRAYDIGGARPESIVFQKLLNYQLAVPDQQGLIQYLTRAHAQAQPIVLVSVEALKSCFVNDVRYKRGQYCRGKTSKNTYQRPYHYQSF